MPTITIKKTPAVSATEANQELNKVLKHKINNTTNTKNCHHHQFDWRTEWTPTKITHFRSCSLCGKTEEMPELPELPETHPIYDLLERMEVPA